MLVPVRVVVRACVCVCVYMCVHVYLYPISCRRMFLSPNANASTPMRLHSLRCAWHARPAQMRPPAHPSISMSVNKSGLNNDQWATPTAPLLVPPPTHPPACLHARRVQAPTYTRCAPPRCCMRPSATAQASWRRPGRRRAEWGLMGGSVRMTAVKVGRAQAMRAARGGAGVWLQLPWCPPLQEGQQEQQEQRVLGQAWMAGASMALGQASWRKRRHRVWWRRGAWGKLQACRSSHKLQPHMPYPVMLRVGSTQQQRQLGCGRRRECRGARSGGPGGRTCPRSCRSCPALRGA